MTVPRRIVAASGLLRLDHFGFDDHGDLVADGVIDPVKVTRTALQNAASISSLMLTTEATVHEIPEKTPPPPPDPHGGGEF